MDTYGFGLRESETTASIFDPSLWPPQCPTRQRSTLTCRVKALDSPLYHVVEDHHLSRALALLRASFDFPLRMPKGFVRHEIEHPSFHPHHVYPNTPDPNS